MIHFSMLLHTTLIFWIPICLFNEVNFPASNVMALTELADRFQVPSLLKICELHLMNCVEIPLVDRLILANQHERKELKVKFK